MTSMLLLDPRARSPRARRSSPTRSGSIQARGELIRHDDWGERALAYPIERRKNGEYHLIQFHAGDKELLDGLQRTLHITDGVLRFRIIKLAPGVPEPARGARRRARAASRRAQARRASADRGRGRRDAAGGVARAGARSRSARAGAPAAEEPVAGAPTPRNP